MENLKNLPLDVVASKGVVQVDSKDTVKSVFEKLIKNDILSVPVFDESSKRYVGLVDILDIVSFLVESVGLESDKWDSPQLFSASSKFSSTEISKITDMSQRNPFISITKDKALYDVANILVNGSPGGVHRVCVVDENNKVVSIITQSAVVAYLYNKDLFKEKKNSTLSELGLGLKKVVTVSLNDLAITAFQKMYTEKISALAVVDETNKLFSNISGKDLKVIKNSDGILQFESYQFSRLFLRIQEYLSLARHDEIKTRSPVFSCSENETIDNVTAKIVGMKVHRLYVRDEESHPIGLVNLADLIGLVL